jgi:hypothetical protein
MQQPSIIQTIEVVALQYAAILDALDQQALNRFLMQTDGEILIHAMRLVERYCDWRQDELTPQLEAHLHRGAA